MVCFLALLLFHLLPPVPDNLVTDVGEPGDGLSGLCSLCDRLPEVGVLLGGRALVNRYEIFALAIVTKPALNLTKWLADSG